MRLLVCTDLDRTLLPNGSEPESPDARSWFDKLAALEEITLAYVTGRDQLLVRRAIAEYSLPAPDFVLADVGSSMYACKHSDWRLWQEWHDHIAPSWRGLFQEDLAALMNGFTTIQLQEKSKQSRYKLSYYAPIDTNHKELLQKLRQRLQAYNIDAGLIWSIDEPANRGLLDIVPANATKRHAIEFLMKRRGYILDETVFSGDSGNDIPVFISPIRSIIVHNASCDVKREAQKMAKTAGTEKSLFLARGGFNGMNGNYAAGIVEGLFHYYPEIINLIK